MSFRENEFRRIRRMENRVAQQPIDKIKLSPDFFHKNTILIIQILRGIENVRRFSIRR